MSISLGSIPPPSVLALTPARPLLLKHIDVWHFIHIPGQGLLGFVDLAPEASTDLRESLPANPLATALAGMDCQTLARPRLPPVAWKEDWFFADWNLKGEKSRVLVCTPLAFVGSFVVRRSQRGEELFFKLPPSGGGLRLEGWVFCEMPFEGRFFWGVPGAVPTVRLKKKLSIKKVIWHLPTWARNFPLSWVQIEAESNKKNQTVRNSFGL